MSSPKVLRLIFLGYEGESISLDADAEDQPEKAFFHSFLSLSPESKCLYINTRRHRKDTLLRRWRRAKRFIKAFLEEIGAARIQILAYSMGCHLAVKAAQFIAAERKRTKKKHRVKVMFLVVPDPKYRECEEDKLDKSKRPRSASAYEECCELWEESSSSHADSPGKELEEALRELKKDKAEIHLIASKFDTVAEWRGNTKELYKASKSLSNVHWWFPPKESPRSPQKKRSRRFRVENVKLDPLQEQSLSEIWVHASLDCEFAE